MPTGEEAPAQLKDLVERFQVCWEVSPEYASVSGARRQIGFALELYGTDELIAQHPDPACPACEGVFAALQQIAQWLLPEESSSIRCSVEPHDQQLSYSPLRGNRPDVSLTIKILHGEGFEQPVDASEVQYLKEMKRHLEELGACEGRWTRRTVWAG